MTTKTRRDPYAAGRERAIEAELVFANYLFVDPVFVAIFAVCVDDLHLLRRTGDDVAVQLASRFWLHFRGDGEHRSLFSEACRLAPDSLLSYFGGDALRRWLLTQVVMHVWRLEDMSEDRVREAVELVLPAARSSAPDLPAIFTDLRIPSPDGHPPLVMARRDLRRLGLFALLPLAERGDSEVRQEDLALAMRMTSRTLHKLLVSNQITWPELRKDLAAGLAFLRRARAGVLRLQHRNYPVPPPLPTLASELDEDVRSIERDMDYFGLRLTDFVTS